LQRSLAVVTARVKGPKARKHTRWWDQVETKGGGTAVLTRELKALDPAYVVPDKLEAELREEIRPVVLRIATEAAKETSSNLGGGSDLTAFDMGDLTAAVEDVISRILGVADAHAKVVRAAVLDSDKTAEDLDEVLDNIKAAHDRGGNWLLMAGRTLGNALVNDAALRTAVRLGVTHTQWLSKRDDRVRHTHVVADGQVRPVGETFTVGKFQLKHPGDPADLPASWGEVANCFVPETEVAGPDVEGSFRAPYVGQVVTLRTAQGRSLTGTPNHPVLTERGWVTLGELNEFDYVIGTRVGHGAGARVEPDVEGKPATIEQVHDALATRAPVQGMPGVAVNFHGDRPAGQVDIVVVDSALRIGRHASVGEQVSKNDFPGRGEAVERGAGLSPAGQFFGAGDSSATGDVGSDNECLTFGDIEPGPTQKQGFRAPAWLYAAALKAGSDGGPVDPERFAESLLALAVPVTSGDFLGINRDAKGQDLLRSDAHRDFGFTKSQEKGGLAHAEMRGDLTERLAGVVELDRVVKIERKAFRGHVYTLQTTAGMFLANSIPTKNCRCGLLFRKPGDAARRMNEMAESARTDSGAPGRTLDMLTAAVAKSAARSMGETLTPTPDGYGLPPVASLVTLKQPIIAYRALTAPLAALPGQSISMPGTPVLGLAIPSDAAVVLTVLIPAGVAIGVAGGAIVLAAGTTFELLGVGAGTVSAQVVA
jgi:hypothetical protein